MLKRINILFIALLVIGTTLLPNLSSSDINTTNINNAEIPTSHLIENVPYTSQLPSHCFFACLEMIYSYYGLDNYSQVDLNILQGASYNLVYQPSMYGKTHRPFIQPPYRYSFPATMATNQGNSDIEFVGGLLGFEMEDYQPETAGTNPIASWNAYWQKLKQLVSNNTPIITCVDFYIWPLFLEFHNLSILTPLVVRGAHSILVVGYNENNRTVCVHDPYPGQEGHPERGTYQWMPISLFRRAVRRAYWDVVWTGFDMYYFNKVSEPMSKEKVFELCHERNIEKLKGNTSVYCSDFFTPNYEKFGIDAWEQIKDDYKNCFLPRLPIYRLINKLIGEPFANIILAYDFEVMVALEVADYLNSTSEDFENVTLKNICKYDATLMYNKSVKFEELTSLATELKYAVQNNTFFKAYSESRLIIEDICDKIDEIIQIEEAIIVGPLEDM